MAGTGEVVAITGSAQAVAQVFVVKGNGQKIPLKIGDTIDPGDVIITPPGVQVEVQAANGQVISIDGEQTVAMTGDILENGAADAQSATSDGAAIQSVIQAINEGRDIGDVLEETAAGGSGGSGNEGGNDEVINLVRVIEEGGSPIEYSYQTSTTTETVPPLFSLPVEEPVVAGDTTGPTNVSGQLPETVIDDTGVSQTDNLTNNKAPTLTGTTELGTDAVVVTIAGNSYTATVAADGTWSATLTGANLADGTYTPSITSTDLAGNATTVAGETFKVDATGPNAADVSGELPETVKDDTGTSQVDNLTNNRVPTLTGTTELPTDTVVVTVDGKTYNPTVTTDAITGKGTWTVDLAGANLVDGVYTPSVVATDVAGNSTTVAGETFTVDSTAPGAPVIVSVNDNVGAIQGEITDNTTGDPANNTITDDATPTITGTAEANSTVSVYNGPTLLGTTTTDGAGNWTFTPGVTPGSSALATGPYTITAQATDAAGNTSPDSNARNFSVDAGAPLDPAITGVTDDVVAIVGNVAPNGVTNDNEPAIVGTGQPGSTVNVYDGGIKIGEALVQPDTNWTFTPTTPLSEGGHTITVDATSPAGVTSNLSGPYPFTVDTLAPNSPAFTLTDDVDPLTGLIVNNATTDDATPTVNGTGGSEPGNTITIYDNGNPTPIGTAIVQPGGTWTFTPTTPLTDGPHSFTTTETDKAGNVSTPAGPTAFTVDTSGITVPTITSVVDDFAPQVGVVAKDGFTNDTTPTINGTAPADAATVNVFVDGVQVATGVPVTAGAWTYTVPAGSALTEGGHTFTATAVKAGTGEISGASGPYAITVDTTAPTAPIIADISDDVGTVQGTVANGADTNDTTPTISGTAEANTVLTLLDGATVVGTATVAADGTWSITTSELNAGIHNFTATTKDAAGNVSPVSNLYGINIDISGPTNVSGVLPETVADDTGASQVDNLTNNRAPTLTGTTEKGSDTVVVTVDGKDYTATVAAGGTWTVTLTGANLADNTYTPSIKATDVAGNSTTVAGETFTVDSTAPGAPVIVSVNDNVGAIQGEITDNTTGDPANNTITDDATPTITGTAEANSTVSVYNGPTLLGTTTTDGAGNWTFTPGVTPGSSALATGPYTITAQATDAAGNTSPDSNARNFSVDAGAPLDPAITGVTDDVVAIVGNVAPNGVTNDNEPAIVGTGQPGSTVNVYDGGIKIGEALVQPDTNWTFTPTTPLSEGGHTITVDATSPAGVTSNLSGPYPFTVDTLAPNSPAFTLTDDVDPLTGLIVNNATTDDATPTVNGTGGSEPGNTITIYDNGNPTPIGTAIVQPGGTWTFTPTTPLTDGPHSFTTTETDKAGNVSTPAGPTAFTVDTSGITVPTITSVVDDFAPQVGVVAKDGFTNDTTPTINGTAPADAATVNVFVDGVQVATGVPVTAGAWTYTVPAGSALTEGGHTFTATAVEAGTGVVSGASGPYAITVDTTAPTAPIIADISDDVGTVQGTVANGADTNDTTPTISGTAEANTVLTLLDGATVVGTATVAADGTWSITTSELNAGIHNFTATTKDAAGNVSPVSNLYGINIDISGPTNVSGVLPETVADDTGASQVDNLTNNRAPTLTGTTEKGSDTVVVTVDGKDYTATVAAGGTWTVTLTGANLADNTYTPSIKATDVAGNSTTVAGETFTVDSTAPGAPAYEGFDDQGTATGIIVDGSTIDDARPEFRNPAGQLASPGDTITIADNGVTLGTALVDGSGNWTFTPTTDLTGASHVITFTATDPAGNVSAPSTLNFTLDTSPPSAQISIDANVAADGIVNAAEAAAGVNVLVTGTVGGDVKVGDLVTINVGTTTYAPVAVFANGTGELVFSASIPGADLADFAGKQVGATVAYTNAAGNAGTASDTQAYTVDLNPANGLISIDANVAGDGIVQTAELTTPVTITGTVGGAAKVGDTVTIAVGTTTADVQVIDLGGGKLGFTSNDFTGQQLADFAGKEVSASITVTDENGNVKTATDTANYIVDGVDTKVPTIALDANVTGDGVINIAESNGTVTVTGTVAGIAEAGDAVVVTINGVDIPTTVQGTPGNLTFSVNVAGSQIVTNPVVSAVITSVDEATGDTVNATTSIEYGVDVVAPSPAIAFDATIAGDGIVNLAESQGLVDVTGTVSGPSAKVGDPVVVRINGTDIATTVQGTPGNLTFSVTVAGTELVADPNMRATVTTTDAAGNAGTGITTAIIAVDVTPPGAPSFVGIDDIGAVVGQIVDQSTIDDQRPDFNGTGGEPGNTITIYDNGVQLGTTIVQPNGTWTFNPGTDLPEGTHNITATETDPAGNVSQPGKLTFTLDTQGASAEISIDANVAGDGIVNATEAAQATNTVAVTGTVGGDAKVNDPIVVTINGQTYNTTAQIINGELGFSVLVKGTDLAADADKIVDAQITVTDAAGNPKVVTDTQAYTLDGGASATISIDANVAGDGIVQFAEAGSNVPVTGTVGGDAKVGDTVTVNIGFNTYTAQVENIGGALVFTASVPANVLAAFPAREVTASVSVTDAAGNTATATDTQAYLVEGTGNTDVPLIALDANIAGDGIINIAESDEPTDFVAVTGTVSGIAKAGDAVEVTVNGVRYATTVAADLTYSVNVLGSQLVADPNVTAKVTSTDGAGDTVSANTAFTYGVDIAPPLPSIALDANIATDGIINLAESQGPIAVTGTVAGDAKVDDAVSVFVNGTEYTTQVIALAGGQLGFTVNVPGAALAADPDIEARVTTKDAAGNIGTGNTAASYGVDLTPPTATVNVSEEGLVGGNPDSNPVGVDTTDATVATGTVNVNVGTVTLTAPTEGLTSGGVNVTWTGSGSKTVIGSAGGVEVIRATIDNDGNYTVTLSKAVDHATAGVEDVKTLGLGVVVTDAAGGVNTGSLIVNIEDDAPIAENSLVNIGDINSNTNLSIVLDLSGSMNGANLNGAKQAISNLINGYDGYGDVMVNITTYGSTASNGSWMTAANALTLINGLSVFTGNNAGTNYDAALAQAMADFNDPGKVPDGQNVLYFFSDGDPNYGDGDDSSLINRYTSNSGGGINAAEQTIWQNWLVANQVNAFAYSVATAVNINSMNPVAYDGTTGTDRNAEIVALSELDSRLADTVVLTTNGNIGATTGNIASDLGADGGFVQSLSYGGVTYVYDNVANTVTPSGTGTAASYNPATNELTIKVVTGSYELNLLTGDYTYTTTAATVRDTTTPDEVINFVLTDNDGDTSAGSVVIDTTPPVPLGVANLMFTIDVSGSMGTNDGVNGQTRLQSEIDSITRTINNYASLGDIRVMVVAYESNATQLSSTWMTASEAIAALSSLNDGGGTNYDAALATTQTAFASAGKLDGALNIGYFFSDGQPSSAAQGVTGSEITAWENFLNANEIKQYALGVGSGVSAAQVASNMDQLAYDGITGTNTNAIKVNSFADLDAVLDDTVIRVGTTGNDTVVGTVNNDIIIGGEGNDTLTGGTGADVFKWNLGDDGVVGSPAADVITDFNLAQGDVLNLKDLLTGENAGNLTNFLHFEESGANTIVHVNSAGNIGAGDTQTITLENVSLTDLGGANDAAIIANLLANNQLIVDQ